MNIDNQASSYPMGKSGRILTTFVKFLGRGSQERLWWGLLALSAVVLLLTALYFQYGMKLEPCVMCIYIRIAVLGLLVAGAIGAIAPRVLPLRWLGLVVWGLSAVYGLRRSLQLIRIQNPEAGDIGGCDYLPNFPEWLPLHEWFPGTLMPTASCSDIPWMWLGLSMAQWTQVTFVIYLVVLFCVLAGMLVNRLQGHPPKAT